MVGEEDDDRVEEEEEEEEVDQVAQCILNEFKPVVLEDERRADQVLENGHTIASHFDGINHARKFFGWLISPLTMEDFFKNYFEKKPFVIKRKNNPGYYEGWFSKSDIQTLLSKNELLFGLHVDVTSYKNNERKTLNKEGVAEPNYIWQKYSEGCSVRLLHPHRWSESLWLMISTLEQFFSCIVGCNSYLTPAGTQGFAPHYDDIEAFILQVEGKKRWRCYAPRSVHEVLPLHSSENFAQEEIGDAILDLELSEGDLLFMPRGTIHQAVSSPEVHSLHVTISTGQRNTYSDLLQLALPRALDLATEDHVELRQSLPFGLFDYFGVAQSDPLGKSDQFLEKLCHCMGLVTSNAPWNAAVDQIAAKLIQSRMPPPSSWIPKSESHVQKKVRMNTKVKVFGPRMARLVVEDRAVIYHMMQNSRDEHNMGDNVDNDDDDDFEDDESYNDKDDLEATTGSSAQTQSGSSGRRVNRVRSYIEFDIDFAEALEILLSGDIVQVKNLPLDKVDSIFVVEQLVAANVLTIVS